MIMVQKHDLKTRKPNAEGLVPKPVVSLAAPVQEILRKLDPTNKVSHLEARAMLARIKDSVLDETGLTRAQLDYEIYLRSLQRHS
jgi:uncharacterized protein YjiS (DUF1127 family)